jgi:Domain of unknown function (DUF4276)
VARLFVLVEGETEETFVNELLAPHLYVKGFEAVSAKLMGNARLRSNRGGVRAWPDVKGDIIRHLRADRRVIITTMVDYYGMPSDPAKQGAWPGRHQAAGLSFSMKAECVESGMAADIESELGKNWDPARFIPFVLMHEFEGVLFSDCKQFAAAISRSHLAPQFHAIRRAFESPEQINDSPLTHPSQRILDLVPDYQKPLFGNIAALEIGFEAIRAECPHFRAWLERLEALK